MNRDTGFPRADAENDFLRARRQQVMSRLAAWMRRAPDDVNIMLPYDEVVAALGYMGERRLGLQVITLDSVVGSVDRGREFDRRFRPTSSQVRERWQRLALAQRRGEAIPPIEVYRVGDMHFVVDGHHRVSVAHAHRQKTIDAYVTEVLTRLSPEGVRHRGDLLVKDYRRLFLERVPLTGEARRSVVLSAPDDYGKLAESIEAWGFRLMQDEGRFLDRPTIAQRWYDEEFQPVIRMLRQAALIETQTEEVKAYMSVACERYRLVRNHRWDDEVISVIQENRR